MGFVDDLLDCMAETVIWRPHTGRDDFGVPTFNESTDGGGSFSARLVRKHRTAHSVQGETIVSTAQLWIGGTPAIAPDDEVELADGTRPPIINIDRFNDEDGPSHVVVFFK